MANYTLPAARVKATNHSQICFQSWRNRGSLGRRTACIVDLDNLCSRRGHRGRHAWAQLDLIAFITAIRNDGVSDGVVFGNRKVSECGSKLWAAGGFRHVAIGANVDESVKLAAVNYALAGINCLILVASDGGYGEVIHAIRRCGIRVELWALRSAVAKHLVFAADAVRWMDDLVQEPPFDGPDPGGQTAISLRIAA